ncbi:hypothetical protein AWB82_03347 [Caballeronia glebae]|jgi:hypothetical protein|uniref:Uncharacterized protein n=1 Tax=Caballeronia glebae TaxID=1777143 RepID=A0A158B147_9BURK|nr:hypothetical protein [Caballeronia glebae]SAK63709.1 hypothetical protein AWB82_03347 [Caballeronia glebae]
MTGALEIKVTISEIATPTLFDALVAVSNPRQRAALLKRLAEEALRSSVSGPRASLDPGIADAATVSPNRDSAIQPHIGEAAVAPPRREAHNEAEPDFDYAFLAENLNLG